MLMMLLNTFYSSIGNDFILYARPWLDIFFFLYFFIINAVYSFLLFLGAIEVYHRCQELKLEDFTYIWRSNCLPEITLLVAAYNESNNIISCIDNLLSVSYRYKQILVVNDGSTDKTLDLLKETYQLIQVPPYYKEKISTKPVRGIYKSTLFPELIVIDKENGEKYDALNAGLNACPTEYFLTVDADTYIEDTIFEALIRPLLLYPETIAIGASVRIRNGCTLDLNRISTTGFPPNFVVGMQALEYLRAFLMREGWDHIHANFILSGAFSIFITSVVERAGGFAPTCGNDLEIIIRLDRLMRATKTPYKIGYVPDPVAWTEAPWTLKRLKRQRILWHRGLLESLWFNRTMFFNPKYGRFGLFVYPFVVFGEAFEPIIEALGFIYIFFGWWFGWITTDYLSLFLYVIWGFTFLFTIFCLLIEELSFRKYPTAKSLVMLVWYSLLENVGYRQLTVWWRLLGFISFFKRFNDIKRDSKILNEKIEKIVKQGRFRW